MEAEAVDTLQFLKEIPVFSELGQEDMDDLIKIAQQKTFKKNERVFALNQSSQDLYVVESGTFVLNLQNKTFKSYKRGDVFGEVALINDNVRTGTMTALDDASVVAISGDALFDSSKVRSEAALKVLRELAKMVTNYLRSSEHVTTKEIIAKGENEHVEFKSSLRWNPESNRNDKVTEQAVIKTVAAFLNNKGGTLLIGVRDDGKILGIGQDRFENIDKLLLHLTRLIKERISPVHMRYIGYEVEDIDGEQVLRIDVEAATIPAYVTEPNGYETFYVRTGPSTTHLKVSKIFDYIRLRF